MTNSNGGIVYGDVMVCLLFAVLGRQGLLALSRAGRGPDFPDHLHLLRLPERSF